MGDIAIRAENLGKLYRVGQFAGYGTLRESLINAMSAPFRRFHSVVTSPKPGARHPNSEYIWALKDVSFEVRHGEAVGIIGRNGAGKTTLLKILSRITVPTEGYAEISGQVGSLLEVGTGFHPELTGGENIYLNGAVLGMKRADIDRKFDEIVAFAEVEKFINTPLKHYSSGMQVRLAFSVAAHMEPEILLVDEVLAVGDMEFQKRCLGKMEDVTRSGRTVLYVSHNMASVINLCQRAILLNAGRIVNDGQPAEVVEHYLATVRSVGGVVVWTDPTQSPGNDIARLHSVRILQDGIDGPTADVAISKEIRIEITYWNLRDGESIEPGIWLRDRMGTLVLSSGNASSVSLTEDPWYNHPHPRGLFQSICRIPGNFLNDGLYSVTVILAKMQIRQVFEDYLLSFQVHDTGEMRKEYHGTWMGAVRPRLAWHTEYIEPKVGANGVETKNNW